MLYRVVIIFIRQLLLNTTYFVSTLFLYPKWDSSGSEPFLLTTYALVIRIIKWAQRGFCRDPNTGHFNFEIAA